MCFDCSSAFFAVYVKHVIFGILQFTPQEIEAIINDFAEPGLLAPTGLHLGGVKYMVIQGEPGSVIRGKKVRNQN